MTIELTPAAAEHVGKMLKQRNKGIGLRLGTKKSGCTGYAYIVDYADEVTEDDHLFETRGIKVVMDKKHLQQLDGMTIDFKHNSILNQGFDFINPNVREMCGCGESFSV